MHGSLVFVTYINETPNLDELDIRDEDNIGRNHLNASYGASNFGDANELGGTKFGRSWEPLA